MLLVAVLVATAAAIDIAVPLTAISVRSFGRRVRLDGQQELPFNACFDTSALGEWTVMEPVSVTLGLPCNASSDELYLSGFAYFSSYVRPEDHVHPMVRASAYPHRLDVKTPRTTLTERDTVCVDLEGSAGVVCNLANVTIQIQ